MTALLTGTPADIIWAAGATPASQNITIPSDATAVYMFWSYYFGTDGQGLASTTLNGLAPNQTVEDSTGGGGDRPSSGSCVWYLPSTGSQSLNVVWDSAPAAGSVCTVYFVKAGNTTVFRDMRADTQTTSTAASVTLTTNIDDLVIKHNANSYGSTPALTSGFTAGTTQTNNSQQARSSYILATGATTVCAAETPSYSGIAAVAIAPATDLGYVKIGASTAAMNLAMRGSPTTPIANSAAGISIWAYISDTATGEEWTAALISNSDQQTILAESAVRTDISTAGWYQFTGGTLASYSLTNGTTVIPTIASESVASALIYYDAGSSGDGYNDVITSVNPIVEVTPPMSSDSNKYSIFIQYSPVTSVKRNNLMLMGFGR